MQANRHLWGWLIPLLLIAFALGARGLNIDPIWSDEYYSIFNAGIGPLGPLDAAGIWQRIATIDPWHTPGFFTFLNLWSQYVGWNPVALRALSLLFGALALAWTYRLGHDLIAPRVGLYGAVIVGSSLFYLYYSHEIRMYTLLVMLVAFLTWHYFTILRSPAPVPRHLWVGLFVGALALLYTHYFAALPLVAVGLYHIGLFILLLTRQSNAPDFRPPPLVGERGSRSDRSLSAAKTPKGKGVRAQSRRWWQITAVFALAGILFLPWFNAFLAGLRLASDYRELHTDSLSNLQVIETVAGLFSNGNLILLAALLALAVTAARQRGVRQIGLVALLLAGLALAVNVAFQIIEDTRLRYLISLWPLLALLVAAGMMQLRRWRFAPPLALGVWVAVAAFGVHVPQYLKGLDAATYIFPLHEEIQALDDTIRPGDTVLNYLPPGLPEGRYDKLMDFYFYGLTSDYRLLQVWDDDDQRVIHRELLESLAPVERLWFAYMPENPPPLIADLEAGLTDAYGLCRVVVDQPTLQLSLYARSPVCCAPDAAPLLRFGDGITLTGFEAVEADDSLSVVLAWQLAPDVPIHRYSVALHLFDAEGNKVAQADYGLEPDSLACRRAAISLDGLPSGEYELRVGVYAWESGEQLSGVVLATGEQGTMLPLTTVSVRE